MASLQDKARKLLDSYFPVHGNNTEAKRAEQPQESKKEAPKEKPQNMPRVEQALKDAGA
jgi:hypothetical protein